MTTILLILLILRINLTDIIVNLKYFHHTKVERVKIYKDQRINKYVNIFFKQFLSGILDKVIEKTKLTIIIRISRNRNKEMRSYPEEK